MRPANLKRSGIPSASHIPTIPAQARELASRLTALFERDSQLTRRLNDAQSRLRSANLRLWFGLHPGALALPYDDTHATGIAADGRIRSEVDAVMIDRLRNGAEEQQLETAVLAVVQEIHWTIHRAFLDYQAPSRSAVSWPPTSARSRSSSQTCSPRRAGTKSKHAAQMSTTSPREEVTMAHADNDPPDETFARLRERANRFGAWLEQLRSGDPAFAEASALYPDDMGEWQTAVYLLTDCDRVWIAPADVVREQRSIAPALTISKRGS